MLVVYLLDVPHNMSPSINAVTAKAALILWADEHRQELHTLLPETSLHSSCTIIDKWLSMCVTGHQLVLTERIRDPISVMMTFSARSAAMMMIESEGVMQVSVITAQKHPLPARGIAHTKRLGNSSSQIGFVLQRQLMCCCDSRRQQRQIGTRVLNTEKETLPREAQSWLINCGQTLRGCGVHRLRRPIQPRAIRGTRGSAQTTEARSQI